MNVKPIQVVLGVLILALLGVVFDLVLRHWSSRGLSVELPSEPALTLGSEDTLKGRLLGSLGATRLTIDDKDTPLSADHQGGFELPLGAEPPGLHVARFEVASRDETKDGVKLWERAVEVGVLKGPFEPPERWHPCAIQVHLRQALLDDLLSPQIAGRLASLKDIGGTPPVSAATAHFTWAGDGVDAKVHIDFTSRTDLEVRGHLKISVNAQHELLLERAGDLAISGSQVTAWHGLLKARLAVAVSTVLGGFSGTGFEEGTQRGLAMVDGKVREKITSLVDDKLQELHHVVPLPGAFAFEGIGFHWRYCRAVEILAGRTGTVGFDVEEDVPKHEAAATFGVVQFPASTVPPIGETAGNIGVDFSPALLNGLLDAAWRSGKLKQVMNNPRWLAAINERRGDTQLDFKVRSVEPLLPPVLEPAEEGALLRMAETRLVIERDGRPDGKLDGKPDGRKERRDARLFAAIHIDPSFDAVRDEFSLSYALSDLAATCHDAQPDGKMVLKPCYADLLHAVQEHQLETAEASPTQPLALSLRHLLKALPFKLSRIHPAVLVSEGQPWFRVTAEMAVESPPPPHH